MLGRRLAAKAAVAAVITPALLGRALAEEAVKIGSFVSTSGAGAPFGLDQLQGMQLAVKQINANGGIAGRQLVLDHRDAAYDKTQAQSVVHRFVEDSSIIGLVGPTSSAEAFAADPAANAAKLPVLAPANGAAGIPQLGPYVHRIGVPEELLLPAATKHAVERLKLKKVAILYAQNDPFATTGFKAFRDELKRDNVEVADVEGYDSKGTVDFTPQVERVKAVQPDALFIAALSNDAPVLLRQLRQSGLTVPIIGNLAFTSLALVAAAGDAVNGLIVAAVWDPSDPSEINRTFVDGYKSSFQRDPTPLSATAYNCIYLIKQALEGSKDFSRAGLQKGLLGIDSFQFLGSRINLVSIGHGLRDATVESPVLFQFQQGKLVKLSS